MKPDSTLKAPALRLEHYAAMTAAFLATANVAQASVVYTDLDPDETAVNAEVLIDMDGDGVWDFRAEQSGYNTGGSTFFFSNQITRLRGNVSSGPAYGWVNNGASFLAGALSAGSSIGPASPITTNTWATVGAYRIFTSAFYSSGSSRGDWLGATDKYFGVSFDLPGGTHYGWIRATVTANADSFTIKDWAYEDQPGISIIAGDMGVSCNTAMTPLNPVSTIGATSVVLSWDVVSGSVGCQVQGNRLSPPGPSPKAAELGSEITSFNVPFAAVGAGTMWSWKVRCACSISPLETTLFSVEDTFDVPILRQQAELKANVFPNPASEISRVQLEKPVAHNTEVRITDLLGKTVDFLILPHDASAIDLDVSALESGMYFIQVGEMDKLPIQVQH